MDFSIPQAYQDYKQEVITFAQDQLQDDVIARDESGTDRKSVV